MLANSCTMLAELKQILRLRLAQTTRQTSLRMTRLSIANVRAPHESVLAYGRPVLLVMRRFRRMASTVDTYGMTGLRRQSGCGWRTRLGLRRGVAWAALLLLGLGMGVFSAPLSASMAAQQGGAAAAAMREGIAAAERNDLGAARRAFARAVQLAPGVEAGHAALGSVLLAQGDLKAALGELQRAHRMNAADGSATLNLARVESGLGEAQTAVALFEGVAAGANPPVLAEEETLAFATSLAVVGRRDDAERELTEALGRGPETAALHDALGALLAQAGRTEQALPHFERAVLLEPGRAEAQYLLGAAELVAGQPEAAVEPLRRAAAAMPNSFEAHLQLGRALSAVHQDKEALGELHRAAALRGADAPVDAVYALALALEASGDAAGSLPLFAAATDGADAARLGSAAWINYALARVQTGDAKGALPLYERAVAMGPESATLHEDYGVAYLQQADLDHAITQFEQGVKLVPESAQLHYDLGLAYKLKDDLGRAGAELTRAAALDPTLPDPGYTLGVIYMQQGRFAESAAELRVVTGLQPANGEAWAMLGGVLKDADDTAGAIAALRRAAELEPEQPSLHVQLAALLVRAGETEKAAAERKVAAELSRVAVSRQRATFALKSGRTLLAEGKVPEAIVQLNTAVEADPKLAESHTLLAEALSRQGKSAEAALERQRAAALEGAASAR
jgi:protein O-GlcNAc transferase